MSNLRPHVLIAGGGIGGLSAALALLQRGFDVDVYEQAGKLEEVGAGVQLSPNGTRALHAMGFSNRWRSFPARPREKRSAIGRPARPGRCSTSGPKRSSAMAFRI